MAIVLPRQFGIPQLDIDLVDEFGTMSLLFKTQSPILPSGGRILITEILRFQHRRQLNFQNRMQPK